MPYAAMATCHPDRKRKTSAGLCEGCYLRSRYATDPEYRERKRARGRRHPIGEQRRCETCGGEYIPAKPHPQNRFCSRACRDRSAEAKQRARAKARTKRGRGKRVREQTYRDVEIFERDGWRCGICSVSIDPDVEWPDSRSASIDHVVPIVRGGSDDPSNLQASHLGCNVRKGDRLVEAG